jgi:hypothetical protein
LKGKFSPTAPKPTASAGLRLQRIAAKNSQNLPLRKHLQTIAPHNSPRTA